MIEVVENTHVYGCTISIQFIESLCSFFLYLLLGDNGEFSVTLCELRLGCTRTGIIVISYVESMVAAIDAKRGCMHRVLYQY